MNEKTKKILKISLLCAVLAAAVVIIAFNVVKDYVDGNYSENYQAYVAAAVFVVVAVLVILAVVSRDKNPQNTKAVAYAAVCIAISFALSYLKMFRMPFGGSVTVASVALLLLYSWYFGLSKGVLCCLVYGLLQAIQDPWVVHPVQFLLDYPLAYTMLGFVSVFKPIVKNKQLGFALGILAVTLLRYVCHFVSGWVFFTSAAPEGVAGWVYSLGYSLYVFVDCAIAGVVAVSMCSVKPIDTMLTQASTC